MAATFILKNPHCSNSTMNLCLHLHSVVSARIEEPWMLTLQHRVCPHTSSIYRCIVRVPRPYRLSVTLHLPAIFRPFHDIRTDTERRSRAVRDLNLLSVAGFWSVNVTSCQYRVMYNSVQILFRLKCKT